jgi:copper(I)-binding protein
MRRRQAPDALVSTITDVADMVERHETMDMGGKMVMQPLLPMQAPS